MKFNPLDTFPNNRMAAWFWFFIAVFQFLANCIMAPVIVNYMRQERIGMALDASGTMHIGPVKSISEVDVFYTLTSSNAVEAFLSRNPKGLINKIKFEQYFVGKARDKALAMIEAEKADFLKFKIHQSVELDACSVNAELTKNRNDYCIVDVTGQINRKGKTRHGGALSLPSKKFLFHLQIVENPNLYDKGMFPLVVKDFKIRWPEKVKNSSETDKKPI